MIKRVCIFGGCLLLIIFIYAGAAVGSGPSPAMKLAQDAIGRAFAESGSPKGDGNLLVLTNAGYGQLGPQTTEAFLDIAERATGCSVGRRSLLAVHSSIDEPLWFSVYRRDTGKMVYARWTGQGFAQQVVDCSPEKILTPEGWRAAAAGPLGANIFSVVSITLTWAVDPPWPLLLAALFHDHFCPGVNSGYMFAEYLREKMPLREGEQYVFVTAPGTCAADALQMVFNATAGKSSGYAMHIAPDTAARYAKNNVRPTTVAMRVNRGADLCDGVVLGFDGEKAYGDVGMKPQDLSPPGGRNNPLFFIARVKASRELARLPRAQTIGYVVELNKFTGKASLADKIAAGDPFAQAVNQ